MKKINGFSWVNPLIWVVLCSFLFAYSFKPGAHSFQVYLDGKMVAEQYVSSKIAIPNILLDPAETMSQLTVKYNECGRTVTGRTITVRDQQNKILKEWHFEGSSTGYKESMTVNVKEILALNQKGNNSIGLYYSSNEFPQGAQIANLTLGNALKTARNK